MKGYLVALLGVCALAAVVRAAAPQGSVKKYLEAVCAVCVIGAVTLPMVTLTVELGGVEGLFLPLDTEQELDYDEIYNQYLAEGNLRVSEDMLEQELCERFERESESIEVSLSVELTEGGLSLTGVLVTLKNGAVSVDPQELREYLLGRLGLECEIVYELLTGGTGQKQERLFVGI